MEEQVYSSKDIEFKNLAYIETKYNINPSITQAEAQTIGEHIGLQPNPIGIWFGKNQRKKIANIPTNRKPSDDVLRMLSQVAEEAKPYKKMNDVQNRDLEKLYMSEKRNDQKAQTEFGGRMNLSIKKILIWLSNREANGNRGKREDDSSISKTRRQ